MEKWLSHILLGGVQQMPPENLFDNIPASPYFENSFPCTNVNSFTVWAVYLIVPRNMGLLLVLGPDKHLRFEDVHFFPVCSFYSHPTIGSGTTWGLLIFWKWLHKVMSKYPRHRLSELEGIWKEFSYPVISSSVIPFSSYPQSLPASESFPMSQLLHSML